MKKKISIGELKEIIKSLFSLMSFSLISKMYFASKVIQVMPSRLRPSLEMINSSKTLYTTVVLE